MPEYFIDLESFVVDLDTEDPDKAWDMAIEWLQKQYRKAALGLTGYPKISNVERTNA